MSTSKLLNTSHLSKIPTMELLATFQTLLGTVTGSIGELQTRIAQKKAEQAKKNVFARMLSGNTTPELEQLISDLKESQETRKMIQQELKDGKERYVNSKLQNLVRTGKSDSSVLANPQKRAALEANFDQELAQIIKEGRTVKLDYSQVDDKLLDPKTYDPTKVDWSKVTVQSSSEKNRFEGLGMTQIQLDRLTTLIAQKTETLSQGKSNPHNKDPQSLVTELTRLQEKQDQLKDVISNARERFVMTQAGNPKGEVSTEQRKELEAEFNANLADGVQRHNMHKGHVSGVER